MTELAASERQPAPPVQEFTMAQRMTQENHHGGRRISNIDHQLTLKWLKTIAAYLMVFFAATVPVSAGPFAHDLSRCLQMSATPAENTLMTRWVFSLMASHPAVAPMASIPPATARHLDSQMADMFADMILVRCHTEAERALQFEGEPSFEMAFEALGLNAMNRLMEHPAVARRLDEFIQFFD